MTAKDFKHNWFIGFIIIGSIIGAFIGLVGSKSHERRIKKAEVVELKHYFHPEWSHIHGIMDTSYKEAYMKVTLDTSLTSSINYPSRAIPTTGRFYLLGFTQDSTLALVGRENDNPTIADPRYQELWLWKNHVIRNKKINR